MIVFLNKFCFCVSPGYYDETSETRSSSSGSEVFNFPGRRQRQSEENVVDVQKNTRRKLKSTIKFFIQQLMIIIYFNDIYDDFFLYLFRKYSSR